MKLPGRRAAAEAAGAAVGDSPAVAAESAPDPLPSGPTAPKGKPTPKRSEQGKRRGPVAPAPMTAAEARQRRKQARSSMTKQERRAAREASRAAVTEHRNRVRAGDESALSSYDKGPVRGYVRDIVDARRNLLGLLLPAAVVLVLPTMFSPQLQLLASPMMLVLMVAMLVDGYLLARKVNRAVDAKFPDHTETRGKLGIYAVSRASQIRRMRTPQPRVSRGAQVG